MQNHWTSEHCPTLFWQMVPQNVCNNLYISNCIFKINNVKVRVIFILVKEFSICPTT